jgi:hypothetical protein
MAVATLAYLHVPIEHLSGNDVAFDVHIRRCSEPDLSNTTISMSADAGFAPVPDQPGPADRPRGSSVAWCRPAPTALSAPSCRRPRFVDRGRRSAARGRADQPGWSRHRGIVRPVCRDTPGDAPGHS